MSEPTSPQPKELYTVKPITYPNQDQVITEFTFSNGVVVHYDHEGGKGDLTLFWPEGATQSIQADERVFNVVAQEK